MYLLIDSAAQTSIDAHSAYCLPALFYKGILHDLSVAMKVE